MTDRDAPALLFLYGSLRRGEAMFDELGLASALEFVSEGTIRGDLYDLGDYPGAVSAAGLVRGEVYRVKYPEIFEALDRYEEFDPAHPETSLFVRQRVVVPEAGEAWAYLYNGGRENRRIIASGDWRKRRSAA